MGLHAWCCLGLTGVIRLYHCPVTGSQSNVAIHVSLHTLLLDVVFSEVCSQPDPGRKEEGSQSTNKW